MNNIPLDFLMNLSNLATDEPTSIVTGSRKYGIPREDSDIDLVIHCTQDDLNLLSKMADKINAHYPHGASLMFGKLNLIIVTQSEKYLGWMFGTQSLKNAAPVEKTQACEKFAQVFTELSDYYSTLGESNG